MNRQIYAMIVFVAAIWCQTACGNRETGHSARPTEETPLADSKFLKDAAGNMIKKDGWFSTNFKRGKRLRLKSEQMLTVDGRSILIEVSGYEYPNPLIIEDAFGDYDFGAKFGRGVSTWGTEFRGKHNSTPYCINLILHMAYPPASGDNGFHNHGISSRYCDADGDGIFETRAGENFRTPAWVK